MLKGFLGGVLLKLFPSMGPKGVIDTQITVYQRLRRKFPSASENDLLNSLIMSRLNAPLSPSTSQLEHARYEPMLQDRNKTLEDVIWSIVEYEYILSHKDQLFKELSNIGAQPVAIVEELEEWKRYIKERVQELRDTKV